MSQHEHQPKSIHNAGALLIIIPNNYLSLESGIILNLLFFVSFPFFCVFNVHFFKKNALWKYAFDDVSIFCFIVEPKNETVGKSTNRTSSRTLQRIRTERRRRKRKKNERTYNPINVRQVRIFFSGAVRRATSLLL